MELLDNSKLEGTKKLFSKNEWHVTRECTEYTIAAELLYEIEEPVASEWIYFYYQNIFIGFRKIAQHESATKLL